jgi:CHAT domain-containing protein
MMTRRCGFQVLVLLLFALLMASHALAQTEDPAKSSQKERLEHLKSLELQQALIHESLGQMDLDAERREEAAAHFEAAARSFHTAGELEKEALTWVSLFWIYSQLDSRASADAALEKARGLAQSSGSRLATALAEFAESARQVKAGIGDVSKMREHLSNLPAVPELKEGQRGQEGQRFLAMIEDLAQTLGQLKTAAASTTPTLGSSSTATGIALDLANWVDILRAFDLFRRADFAAGRDVLLSALAHQRDRDTESVLLVALAVSYVGEAKSQEAIRYLVRAVDVIEQGADDVRLQEFLAGYLSRYQDIYSFLIELLVQSGRTDEAFEYAERARARAFLQGLGNPRREPGRGADAELVSEAEGLRKQILDVERRMILAVGEDRDRMAKELQQVRDRYQSILVRLKVTIPAEELRAKAEPQQIAAIRDQLGPDTALISYYVSPVQGHVWVLDKESLHHVTLPTGPADMKSAVCWAEQIGHRGSGRGVKRIGPSCEGASTAEELYRKLIAPLREFIHHRRLIIVPYGELHYLPFAALRDPQTGRYLIQDFTLSYAPSASVLGFLHGKETPVEGKALVLGSPEEHDPRFGPIPAARHEAKAVGRLLGTPPLFGAQASEGRLYGLSGKVDLLHIAAHGFYESRSPLFSRIVLAPDKEHDGKLEVHEILSDLDLSGVNLVVLSACETARGERSRGDEVTGLTRAFLYAGSPGVISTLWNIDDEAAAILMAEFYRRLFNGTPVAEALQQAQVALLRNPRFQDPCYWAAFSLAGDPQGRWRSP